MRCYDIFKLVTDWVLMKYEKINAIATCSIAFSTFLGVLAAIIYYLYQIKETNLVEVILWGIVYIDVNLLFLYILKR